MENNTDVPYYEYIVVGCGGIGSAALYWLAKRAGKDVLGIEQFRLGHDHGGSQDHSRIIRMTYYKDMYTKLVSETYKAWEEVEKESGTQLLHKTGSLGIARAGTTGMNMINSHRKAMDARNIHYEKLSGLELNRRYPQWTVGDDIVALYQTDGGLVDPALGNSVHIQLARAHGAQVLEECIVNKLEPIKGDQCLVHTTKRVFRCRRVVLTAGAWLNHLLCTVGCKIPLVVTQEQSSYYATPNVKSFTKENFPVFMYYTEAGFSIYGLPTHVNSGFKIGIDSAGPAVTTETRDYIPDKVREDISLQFMKKNLPKAVGPLMYTKTCLYTTPLDKHFIVDSLAYRGMPQLIACCGAGHAYKFASFLGKVLSQIAIDGQSEYDVSGFSINRKGVQDPTTKPGFWRGDLITAKL